MLACGWGLSLLYWWFGSRRSVLLAPAVIEPSSLRHARAELRQACDAADAAAARHALLTWGQALLAPRAIHNLHQLCDIFGPEFAQQVEILNTSLYARSRDSWQGTELLGLCQQIEQSHTQNQHQETGLMPLNPAG